MSKQTQRKYVKGLRPQGSRGSTQTWWLTSPSSVLLTLKLPLIKPGLNPSPSPWGSHPVALSCTTSQNWLGSSAPGNWFIQMSWYIQRQSPTPLTNQLFFLVNLPLSSGFPLKQHVTHARFTLELPGNRGRCHSGSVNGPGAGHSSLLSPWRSLCCASQQHREIEINILMP